MKVWNLPRTLGHEKHLNCSSFPSRTHCSAGSGPWVGALITASGQDTQDLLSRVCLSLVILLVISLGCGDWQEVIRDFSGGKRFPLQRLGKITPAPVSVHERWYLCGFSDISGGGISVRDWLPQEIEQHERAVRRYQEREPGEAWMLRGLSDRFTLAHSRTGLAEKGQNLRAGGKASWQHKTGHHPLPPHWPSNPSPSLLRSLSCS